MAHRPRPRPRDCAAKAALTFAIAVLGLRTSTRRSGLTTNDVVAKLREQGVRNLGELRYVLYETKGELRSFARARPAS